VKAEHINPFIISVCKVMKDMCMLDLKIGKPAMSKGTYAGDTSIIRLGLIGGLTGEVVLNIAHVTALQIVSKMVMMPVETIDEMGQSAISELGNMIAGNAATVFANNNIIIDITPPTYYLGSDFKSDVSEYFSIPFTCEAGELSVDVFVNE
jgi:chemotaxis protein CheX